MTTDHKAINHQILSAHDLRAVAEGWGLEFDGTPSAKGWLSCRAVGREDSTPSAGLCVASANGSLGKYRDHAAGDGKAISFFDLGVLAGKYGDWREARADLAKKAGVKLGTGKGHKTWQTLAEYWAKRIPGTLAGSWMYHKADGAESFVVCRFNLATFDAKTGKADKQFRPIHRRDDGTWKSGDPLGLLPLYRLPTLTEAKCVYIPEGEKAADALTALGLTASTTAHGSKSAHKSDLSPLAGKIVVLTPDNDKSGAGYVGSMTAELAKLKPLPVVKVLMLPDLPPAGDAVEFIAARREAGRTDAEIRNEVEALTEATGAVDLSAVVVTAKPTRTEDEKAISNFATVEVEGDDGETKKITVPASMTEIIDTINELRGNWPRRVDNMLFVDDPSHGVDYFDRRTTAGMFGWLRRHHKVTWAKGGSLVSQAELFAEIERTTQRYEAIELLPHEPPVSGIYYRGKAPPPGDGSHLRKLLDRFRPETTIDRDLIQAAFMTPAWGGLPGCRPAFVVTSDDGRGVGKTMLAETVGYLFGGVFDVSNGEDIEQLKTRMLTPGARTKRIALLDNVKSLRLSWAELESLITSPVISGRQMYVGEGQRPNLLTWFITLNGVSMATDMAQRSVIIKVVRGKNDGPWLEQTREYIDKHRAEIIGDIIGMLRAEQFPLRSYSRWATWEQHVLCRLPEPGDAQRLILERQGEANCELDEAEIIEEHFAEQLRRLHYDPQTAQVRIPVAIAARWFGWAVGEQTKTAAASKRLHQLAGEGQSKRIAPDPSRTYGRCFIWTGPDADVVGDPIRNDLADRLEHHKDTRER